MENIKSVSVEIKTIKKTLIKSLLISILSILFLFMFSKFAIASENSTYVTTETSTEDSAETANSSNLSSVNLNNIMQGIDAVKNDEELNNALKEALTPANEDTTNLPENIKISFLDIIMKIISLCKKTIKGSVWQLLLITGCLIFIFIKKKNEQKTEVQEDFENIKKEDKL